MMSPRQWAKNGDGLVSYKDTAPATHDEPVATGEEWVIFNIEWSKIMADERLLREAIFSSGTEKYLIPPEPGTYEEVTIKCRTGKDNADRVYLISEGKKYRMEKEPGGEIFDYYQTKVRLGTDRFEYYFLIEKGNERVYFNKQGDVDNPNPFYSYKIMPGFKTPGWAKGAVFYQIYVDRFCNGDRTNSVVDDEYSYIGEHVTSVKDWNKFPASMGVREFYGGDLQGVLDKLDYLEKLGVEVIYLNPIFVSPSNHKYDTQDYDYIDPHFTVIKEDGGEVLEQGDNDNAHASKYIKRVVDRDNLEASNEFFAHFVEKVHERGMKLILDGVFNHCGSFNKWLDREGMYQKDSSYASGAYIDEDSPYHSFFEFFPDGEWPCNSHYDGWWGHDTLPKLNYEGSDKLFEYIMRIAKKWVSAPYNVDGWRLDVAADLGHSEEFNHKFWREFRKNVKEANPDALILAEHYGDPTSWLSGDQWDTIMNYDAFMEPVSWFITGVDKHSDVSRPDLKGNSNMFFAKMTEFDARFSMPSLQVAMNELSNHDHSRFLTRTNGRVGRTASAGPQTADMGVNRAGMMAAVMIQMTWCGAPTVYYGDEAGVCGWTDPDNRRTYPWGNEDWELIKFHKELIRIHKDYEALKTGSLIYLLNEQNLIGYGRFDDKDKFFVVVQVGGEPRTVTVPVWRLEIGDGEYMATMMYSDGEGYNLNARVLQVKDGCVTVELGTDGAILVKSVASPC